MISKIQTYYGSQIFSKMVEINILFLVSTRLREIEVQISKNQSEITFNIFRKLRATKIYRNVFMTVVTSLQVAGTAILFVANN